MMITELVDQQDFLSQLRAWGVSPPARLADCRPLLADLLAGPDGDRWRKRLNTLLAQRALLHPDVLAVVEESLQVE